MNRGKHPTQAKLARVTANEIAVELGLRVQDVRRLLRKHGWWIGDGARRTHRNKPTTYDALVIEKLRGLLDQPHRQLDEPGDDWLTRYLEEGHAHQPLRRGAHRGGHDRDQDG